MYHLPGLAAVPPPRENIPVTLKSLPENPGSILNSPTAARSVAADLLHIPYRTTDIGFYTGGRGIGFVLVGVKQ